MVTKTTAIPLKGALKECPSCGAEIQGKTNKNGSVFFNCYSKIHKDTGKYNPDGVKGEETCAYREAFGRVMSKKIKQEFNKVSANGHIKKNRDNEGTRSSNGEDRGDRNSETGSKSISIGAAFFGGLESAFD